MATQNTQNTQVTTLSKENRALASSFKNEAEFAQFAKDEPSCALYLQSEKIMNTGDVKLNKDYATLIQRNAKVESDMGALRKVIVAGIVDPKEGLVTDPKLVAAKDEAVAEYAHRLAVMFVNEKQLYINAQAADAGMGRANQLGKFFKSLNGNQKRSLFSATKGVPQTESGKKAFTMLLKRTLQKALDNGKITSEQMEEKMISFRTAEDGAIKALKPVDRAPQLTQDEQNEKARKEIEKKIEKAVAFLCGLDADNKHAALKAIADNSHSDADMMALVVKEVQDQEAKVEDVEAGADVHAELVADYREAVNFLEQAEKGNKKPTKAQRAKMTNAIKAAEKKLIDAGIELNTIQ